MKYDIEKKSSHALESSSCHLRHSTFSDDTETNEIEIIFIDAKRPRVRETRYNAERYCIERTRDYKDEPSMALAEAGYDDAGLAGNLFVLKVALLRRDLLLHRTPAYPVILQRDISRNLSRAELKKKKKNVLEARSDLPKDWSRNVRNFAIRRAKRVFY